MKSAEEMARVFAEIPEACRNTLAVAERCNLTLEFNRFHLPRYVVPDGHTLESYLQELARAGLRPRYGAEPGRRPRGAARPRAGRHREDGLRRLLPGGVGLHPLRAAAGHRGGSGARVVGGVAGGLLPRHHQRRSHPVRAPVRAIPEPRADLDAGHGHRLRRRPARRGHPLRGRPLRARPGRPHHHVRDAGGQGGHPRRGPRAGHALRRRRPHRQARPGLPAQHHPRRRGPEVACPWRRW